jgi:cytochrome b561
VTKGSISIDVPLLNEGAMQLWNDSFRFGAVSQWLHWTTVVLVVVLIVMGKAGDIEADEPNALYMWHGSLGVLVLLLTLIRILWAVVSRPPPLPQTMSIAARSLALTVHIALYVLLVAVVFSGWLVSSAEGAAINVFGVASIPSLNAVMASAAGYGFDEDAFEELHEVLGNVLLVFAALHALAAVKHQFFDRDHLLARMLPRARKVQ